MSESPWNLGDVVPKVMAFRDARGWRRSHRPKELAAAISIEAAELQELFLWREAETSEQVLADSARLASVREEIADVTIFLVTLAHELEIDLCKAVLAKLSRNEDRFPPSGGSGQQPSENPTIRRRP